MSIGIVERGGWMTVNEFLTRLQNVKSTGENQYTCRCPSHDDSENSLAVSSGDDGRVLVSCFAGCSADDIVSSMGLSLSDLMPPLPDRPTTTKPKPTISATYDYTDEDGKLVLQVLRYKPKSFRQRKPKDGSLGGGSAGWEWKLGDIDKPLYNLPAVIKAIAAKKAVWVVEGEKDADALNNIGLVATTNAGGASVWSDKYSVLLATAPRVFIVPDNDAPGEKRSRSISKAINKHGGTAIQIALPNLTDKQDVSDYLINGGCRDDLINLAVLAMKDKQAEKASQEKQAEKASQEKQAGPGRYYKALGYRAGRYYFLPYGSGEVHSYSAPDLARGAYQVELAPSSYWEAKIPDGTDKEIAEYIILESRAAGLFDISRMRGRGAWFDDNRIVVHQGDKLLVDGIGTSLTEVTSHNIYERSVKLDINHDNPLPYNESIKLVKLCNLLRWSTPTDGLLLAGWIFCAPICGVLRWRPHIWVTGPAGSGKTWVMENVIAGVLGNLALQVQSVSTEAGIRQALGSDARPVLFDEAEMEDQRSVGNIQRVLDLARQASSEGGSSIKKGTAGGQVKSYDIRSMFCLSSIGVGVHRRADESRVSVLSLTKAIGGDHFDKIKELAADVCTPAFAKRLVARSCNSGLLIRHNADIFAQAITEECKARRVGDQLGALLGSCFTLTSDTPVTLDEARSQVAGDTFAEVVPNKETTDEHQLLNFIIEQTILIPDSLGKPCTRSIGELISVIWGNTDGDVGVSPTDAVATLKRNGIRVEANGLVISNTHSGIKKMLVNTPWATNWARFLARIDGVEKLVKTVSFPGGIKSRCVFLNKSILT